MPLSLRDAPIGTENDRLIQALVAKGLETVQLSEPLVTAPEDDDARAALMKHLSGLREAAAELGFVHLESALGEAMGRLERESFSAAALSALRILAGRYASLAAIRSRSGAHPIASGGEVSSAREASLHSKRVLVAIDDAPVRWSYVGLLRDAGARVTEARDGLEALELARRSSPDLIVADMRMPRLDGLALCAAVRRERALDTVPVVLLSERAGEPRQALSDLGAGSRALVDALLEALAEQRAAEEAPRSKLPHALSEVTPPAAELHAERLNTPEAMRESPLMRDPLERENLRAQSTVAMHREPANRAPAWTYPIWRLSLGPEATPGSMSSGFDLELQMISRVLGFGFIVLLTGTVALLVWRQWAPRVTPVSPTVGVPGEAEAPRTEPAAIESPPASSKGSANREDDQGLSAFSGQLRPGVDAALGVGEGQGVLELGGPSEVTIEIDGVDYGALPAEVVLDEGRHTVRYRIGARSTYRFYIVKPGATRVLRVAIAPSGLIDAR